MRLLLALMAILFCLSLTACKDQSEAESILPKANKSFPDAAIFKFDKRILWVQTHVDGISADVANTMFRTACQQAAFPIGNKFSINIQTELAVDNKQVLIVGFQHFWAVWLVKSGVDVQGVPVGYQIMNYAMLKQFFTSRLGYFPTDEQILVLREQDLQNVPKGQPMQLPTLASLVAAKKAKMLEELQQQPSQ
jgi:hypothetical protein